MKFSTSPLLLAILLLLPAGDSAGSSTDMPGLLSPIKTVPPTKRWLACKRDTQCVATALSCHGWIAVNAAHESDVQRWYSRENADFLGVVECSGPSTPKPDAVCRSRVCRLK